jgi:hypothetical protein
MNCEKAINHYPSLGRQIIVVPSFAWLRGNHIAVWRQQMPLCLLAQAQMAKVLPGKDYAAQLGLPWSSPL